jgi:hypothetical protein
MANLNDVSPEQLPGEESTEAAEEAAEQSTEDTGAADTAATAKGLENADEAEYSGD